MPDSQETSVPIEAREVRGITVKVAILIVSSIISSTIAIIMTINSFRTEMIKMQANQDRMYEVMDLKMRTMDIRITNLEGEQKEQNERIQKNDDRLNDAKGHAAY